MRAAGTARVLLTVLLMGTLARAAEVTVGSPETQGCNPMGIG